MANPPPSSPIITTSRLRLRPITPDDVNLLDTLNRDEGVMEYIPSTLPSISQINASIERQVSLRSRFSSFGLWIAYDTTTDTFIGWFLLRPLEAPQAKFFTSSDDLNPLAVIEVGYRLRTAAWGKGYATEGARACILHAFKEAKVEYVMAVAMPGNIGSMKVLDKCGLRTIETSEEQRRELYPEGKGEEFVLYAVSRKDWEKANAG